MKLFLVAHLLGICQHLMFAAGSKPASNPTLSAPFNNSTLARLPPTSEIRISVPGTATSVDFIAYKSLLYQSDTDLCIIEALANLFATVVREGKDGFLPLHTYLQSYGEVVIQISDWAPPAQRLTYGIVVSALRGVAVFASLYGYYEVDFEVYDGSWGHVGKGTMTAGGRSVGTDR